MGFQSPHCECLNSLQFHDAFTVGLPNCSEFVNGDVVGAGLCKDSPTAVHSQNFPLFRKKFTSVNWGYPAIFNKMFSLLKEFNFGGREEKE